MFVKHASGLLLKNSSVPLDLKAVGDSGTIEGYGSVFGNIDSYGEIVMPGAFTQSLVDAKRKGQTIKMLWQHNPNIPIGVWDDLAEDSKGLYCKGRILIDVTQQAKEAHGLIKEGAMDGLSIGYRTIDADPHPTKPNVINLKTLALKEISPVTFQANDRARVDTVKHFIAAGTLPTVREFEEILRDAGFSKTKAAAIATASKLHLRGEPEVEADPMSALFAAMHDAVSST